MANAINLAPPSLRTTLLTPLYRSLSLSFAGADVWAPPPTSFNNVDASVAGSTQVLVPTLVT